jgi:predicted ATPase
MKIAAVQIKNWKSFEDSGLVKLDQINVLLGGTNSGKSALVRAVHLMQRPPSAEDLANIRLGATQADIHLRLSGSNIADDIKRHYGDQDGTVQQPVVLDIMMLRQGNDSLGHGYSLKLSGAQVTVQAIEAVEPKNFIYTYLSKRKVTAFGRAIDRSRTLEVRDNLENLVAKVYRLANSDYERAAEYDKLCKEVLGFRISTFASEGGMQAGISVGRFDHIPIEAMGEGVSSQLGLITHLCMAEDNLFLIEEPENDIHPQSLKALLDVIIEKSASNQFIVTTHSNIVTRYLGAAPNSKLFNIELEFAPNAVPTSTIREVEKTPAARIAALRRLGYELYDFDLWEGWLILEEASAEVIIRDYLIPWFAPRLSRVRTLSAGGTSKVEPAFEDFRRLFLFTHLEPQYKERAWVVVDGDVTGIKVVKQLRAKYPSWPAEHFRTLSKPDFEHYYPKRFKADVDDVLALTHDAKKPEKDKLTEKVKAWCDKSPDEARREFEGSAAEVIELLREIEQKVFG